MKIKAKLLSIIICGVSMLTSCGIKNETRKETSLNNSAEAYNNWYYVSLENSAIYNDRNRASITEYPTMKNSILCNIPNCSHSSSNCIVSILKNTSQLPIIYNNCAYYFINSDSTEESGGKIHLDLKTKVQKYDFNNRTITDIASIGGFNANYDQGCYLIGSNYYFTANYGNPRYDELGNVAAHNNGGGGNLFSVDLENGNITDYGEIFDYDALKKMYPTAQASTSTYLMGKIEDKLYIRIGFMKDELHNNESWAGMTYTFDLNTHEFEKINDYFSICAMNGYLAYTEKGSTGKLIIEDIQKGAIIDNLEILSPNGVNIVNNKIWHDSKCFDISTGIEQDIDGITCLSKFDNSYVIYSETSGNEISIIPCEEIDKLFK